MDQLSTSPAININSISYRTNASCGYCQGRKSTKHWVTTGFQCLKMTSQAYQNLMERGWRRCGMYYYTPHLFESCCQAYTIRLDTYNYQKRYTHQKVLRKIRHIQKVESTFLSSSKSDEDSQQYEYNLMKNIEQRVNLPPELRMHLKEVKLNSVNKHFQLKNIDVPSLYNNINQQLREISVQFCQNILKNVDQIIHTIGYVQENKFLMVRARMIEFIGAVQKNFKIYETKNCGVVVNIIALLYANCQQFWKSEMSILLPNLSHPDLLDLLQEIINVQLHSNTVKVSIKRGNQMVFGSEAIYKYRTIKLAVFKQLLQVQKQQKPKLEQSQNPFQSLFQGPKKTIKECPIQIRWVKAQFEHDSYDLYCSYQRNIHGKETCSKESYLSFLCLSAIQEYQQVAENGTTLDCGCWHMKYYLDDTLIAVGVVDILPHGLSSVYFFYDPQYRKYSLGVYGALREIEFIQMKQKSFPYMRFYYLGFYIQDSQKMVYKGDYEQSDLLCPITKTWVPLTPQLRKQIDEINETMVKSGNVPDQLRAFNTEAPPQEQSNDMDQFIQENVSISFCQKYFKLTELKQKSSNYMISLFRQIVPLIGRDLVKSFIFRYHRG